MILVQLSCYVIGFQKCHLFGHTTIKNVKNSVSKIGVITFTWFWAIAQPNIMILAWSFAHWLMLYSDILYIPFFDIFKNFDFVGFNFQEIEIMFSRGWKPKNLKIRYSDFVEPSIQHFLLFYACGLFQNSTFRKPLKFDRFSTQNRVTWRH